jgi:TrwC relaxase
MHMHRTKATKTGYGCVAICEDDDCGWMGGDHPGHEPESEEAVIASPEGHMPLWFHGKSAGAVFQAVLRAEFLREFGLEFEQVTNGYADLKGFGRNVIDALSTRSREIAGWVQSHGVDSVAAKQIAAYRTRDAKDYGIDEDDRRGEWIELMQPFGLTPESAAEMVAEAEPREPRQVSDAHLDAAVQSWRKRILTLTTASSCGR